MVFTVTSEIAVNCTELKNGIATVNSDNYTFANNVLTIKKEYLATATNGDKTFTLKLDSGDSLVVTISITD